MKRWMILLAALLVFTMSSGVALAEEATVVDKLNSIDKGLYGSEQTGALLERVQKLEKDVFTNSRKILSDYAFLRQQIKINEEVIKMNNGKNADSQKVGFQTFVDLIQFQQNHYGWINSVTVPVLYNLLLAP